MPSLPRSIIVPAAALVLWSCGQDGPGVGPDEELDERPDLSGLPVSESVVDAAPAVCGVSTQVDLVLGTAETTGAVTVTQDEAHLYVTYRSDDGLILGTALFVGEDPADVPTTQGGTPDLLHFPYLSGHQAQEVIWEVPLDALTGANVVLAAYGQIGSSSSWGRVSPSSRMPTRRCTSPIPSPTARRRPWILRGRRCRPPVGTSCSRCRTARSPRR